MGAAHNSVLFPFTSSPLPHTQWCLSCASSRSQLFTDNNSREGWEGERAWNWDIEGTAEPRRRRERERAWDQDIEGMAEPRWRLEGSQGPAPRRRGLAAVYLLPAGSRQVGRNRRVADPRFKASKEKSFLLNVPLFNPFLNLILL